MLRETFNGKLIDGELAAICEDFELKKGKIDWSRRTTPLILTGLQPGCQYPVFPAILKIAFDKAFRTGIGCWNMKSSALLNWARTFRSSSAGAASFVGNITSKSSGLWRRY